MDKGQLCSVLDEEVEDYLFTCEACGSHELYVEHYYTTWLGDHYTHHVERASLNIEDTAEHRPEDWEKPEEVESGRDDSVDVDDDEDYEEELDEESHEWYVRCEGCDREISFGWSHPDRGGRIWPSECSDFNPWKCWPEPRYWEEWGKRGWLRPQKS
jgi:hypothetical protein